jgi:excisionase family DNA binding protein
LALRPREAAAALGIGARTLRKWMRDAALPYLRVDGVVLIPQRDLEEWLNKKVNDERKTDALAAEILDNL